MRIIRLLLRGKPRALLRSKATVELFNKKIKTDV